ncbi:MAG: hypothetical protein RI902_2490, partial [Pseudomonadota bacterium]|jgi:hypothetical protein
LIFSKALPEMAEASLFDIIVPSMETISLFFQPFINA